MTGARLTMLILVCLAVAGIAVACGSESSDQDDQQVQLVYQDWRTAWFSPMVEEMMENFMKLIQISGSSLPLTPGVWRTSCLNR